MSHPPLNARRNFLATLGASAIAGTARGADGNGSATQAPAASSGAAQSMLEPGLVYLNTATLGPTPRAVMERTMDIWRALETSPVRQVYGDGLAHTETDRVPGQAAALLGCDADELLITRNTTEAMNSVAQGMLLNPGDHVLTTDQEHDGGSVCWRYLARRRGVVIDRIPIAPTEYDPTAILRRFAAALQPGTRVISVSHVITSTGLRMPVAEIAALARARGIICIVDGAQAVGGIAVNLRQLNCHAYATSGHKWLLGPKGTGLLYLHPDAKEAIQPIQREDGHAFVSHSSGSGSLPLVAGLGAAIEALRQQGMANVEARGIALRNRAYEGLRQLGSTRLRLVGPPPGPLATPMVAFELDDGVDSRHLRDVLQNKHRIIVKMVEKQWFNGLRIATNYLNTEDDVDAALRALRVELG